MNDLRQDRKGDVFPGRVGDRLFLYLLPIFLLTTTPGVQADAPSNDAFAAARLITGAAGTTTGTTLEATREGDEPGFSPEASGASVWYSWHCSSGGTLDLTLSSPSAGHILIVFHGRTLDSLERINASETGQLHLELVPGQVYRIGVDGLNGGGGTHTLAWKQTFLPGGGPDLTVPENLIRLSVVEQSFPLDDCEVTERCIAGGKRRLLRFDMHTLNLGSEDIVLGDPAASPLFQYAPCHNHYHFEALAVYRVLNSSNNVVRAGNKFGFCVEDVFPHLPWASESKKYTCDSQGLQAGWSDVYSSDLPCQYVDITALPPGDYTLEIEVDPLRQIPESDESNNSIRLPFQIEAPCTGKPANDEFLNAQLISGPLVTVLGNTACATRQHGEPSHAPLSASPASKSIWFSWTAPESGEVILSTEGSGFDTVLAVYQGNTLAANSRVVHQDDISEFVRQSRLKFNARADTLYRFVVDGAELADGAQGGVVVLNVNPSGNDAFDTRFAISGSAGSLLGYAGNATHEPGEPMHALRPGEGSLWYEWTAPASGVFAISTVGSDTDTLLAVYRGGTLGSLAGVAADDDSGGHGTSWLEFAADQGATYQIAVDRKQGAIKPGSSRVIKLGWIRSDVSQSPIIVQPPASVTTFIGSNALFTVSARGSSPLSFEWFQGVNLLVDGPRVTGARTPNLRLTAIEENDRGLYHAKVSNSLGEAATAHVNLVAATPNRVMFVEPMEVAPGQTRPLVVSMAAQGGENRAEFSLSFDPSKLQNPVITLAASLPPGSSLETDMNLSASGWIGARVALPAGQAFLPGKHPILEAAVQIASGLPDDERIRVCFDDRPTNRRVEAIDGTPLETLYACGALIVMVQDSLAVRILPDGTVELTLTGAAGATYAFQLSPDLLNWSTLSTELNLGGTHSIVDATNQGVNHRFYRTLRLQ